VAAATASIYTVLTDQDALGCSAVSGGLRVLNEEVDTRSVAV
jgi:hypothetical protein